jgi:hypothetical protein
MAVASLPALLSGKKGRDATPDSFRQFAFVEAIGAQATSGAARAAIIRDMLNGVNLSGIG